MIVRNRSGWLRVTKSDPCLVCGHNDHCTRTADGQICKCTRVSGGKAVKQKDGTEAWVYFTEKISGAGAVKTRKAVPPPVKLSKPELRNLIKQHQADLTPARLDQWAKGLGLSVKALRAYGIGYDARHGAASFPMYDGTRDAKGNPNPCGIRLRIPSSAKKLCVPGSFNGIFIPVGYDPAGIPFMVEEESAPLLLLMPEGPTDAAAAFDLGFRAVGRPSNCGGFDQVAAMLQWGDKQDVVIVADHDEAKYANGKGQPYWPGQEGALALAEHIIPFTGRLRIIKPPKGTKDLRQWLREGSTTDIILAIVAESEKINRDWIGDKKRRVYELKRKLNRR